MIIVKLLGGLGNQMFQYAAAKSLSLHLNQPIKHDLRGLYAGEDIRKTFELDIFGLEPLQATREEYFKYYRKSLLGSALLHKLSQKFGSFVTVKDHDFVYLDNFFELAAPDTYLRGLFQSEKYFTHVRPAILDTFTFKEPLDETNKRYADSISKTQAVSLHIRRGEFAYNQNFNNVIGICGLDYYAEAINDLIKRLPDTNKLHFFVFSDDLAWAEKNLITGFPTTYVSGNIGKNSYRDMQLMSLCKHNIIANSTFSWWGAWLNNNPDKIVYGPKKWFAGWDYNTKDLIPTNWIKI